MHRLRHDGRQQLTGHVFGELRYALLPKNDAREEAVVNVIRVESSGKMLMM